MVSPRHAHPTYTWIFVRYDSCHSGCLQFDNKNGTSIKESFALASHKSRMLARARKRALSFSLTLSLTHSLTRPLSLPLSHSLSHAHSPSLLLSLPLWGPGGGRGETHTPGKHFALDSLVSPKDKHAIRDLSRQRQPATPSPPMPPQSVTHRLARGERSLRQYHYALRQERGEVHAHTQQRTHAGICKHVRHLNPLNDSPRVARDMDTFCPTWVGGPARWYVQHIGKLVSARWMGGSLRVRACVGACARA